MTIKDDIVEIATPTGPMRTYIFRPAVERKFPGVVLYSEIFQATAPIRRTAAIIAGHGYVVAVPEVYHELESAGTVLAYDQQGADIGNAHKYGKEVSAFDADARAVLDHLKQREDCTGRLGAVGICLGGHLAFRAAMNRDVLATACFYATDIHSGTLGKGKHDDSLERATDIKGELLHIWGRQDPHVPLEGRNRIKARLDEIGTTYQWIEVNGAHAFLRDEGYRYDPALALQCYGFLFELFHRRLALGLSESEPPAAIPESKH
jgi:carboxymethylenebutenolidase